MTSSHYAATGYNPWSDGTPYPTAVPMSRPDNAVSQVAAERYALLQAVSDLRSRPQRPARRRLVWRRSPSTVTKTV